jgi:uncharacterized protein (TIGR02301 family)
MRNPRGTGLAALILAALAVGAGAQTRTPPAAAPAPAETPAPAPVYEGELLQLAELLGALSHLAAMCERADAGDFRRRMEALMAAEGTTEARREALAGAFNAGARAYALTHIRCTQASRAAIEAKLSEGAAIARRLVNRYGN